MLRIALIGAVVWLLMGCGTSTGTASKAAVAHRTAQTEGPSAEQLPRLIDLPLYPGSKLLSSKETTALKEKRYSVILVTADAPQKVISFYKTQGIDGVANSGEGQAIGKTKHGNTVIIHVKRKGDSTEVTLRASSSGRHG